MAKMKIVLTNVLMVVVIIFLATGNGWAISKYAQKYGIGCKSCHSSGSELNDLGQKFWKNGHTFGDMSAEQLEKLKQNASADGKNKAAETPGRSSDKPAAVVSSKTDEPTQAVEVPEVAPPLPETKVYRRKTNDGTLHFSDTPDVNPQRDTKSSSDKSGKKITRTGFRPLSAVVPKASRKTAAPKPDKVASLKPELPEQPEVAKVAKKQDVRYSSFEECMEQALVAMPHPETSDAAMEQFREAEDICAPYIKKQP